MTVSPVRHPLDPDPTLSTKAAGVLALGIVALFTAPVVAGIIPATVALVLARTAHADIRAAEGFLTGSWMLRSGARLAWIAIVIVATVLVGATVWTLLDIGNGAGSEDFAPDVD